jgi:hypothetical protein
LYNFKIKEDTTEFGELQKMYEGLLKNGEAGKFYARYYSIYP